MSDGWVSLTVCLGDVVDQLHDEHSLSDSCSSKESNLASPLVGGEEIDDLDASDENFLLSALLDERRSLAMDGP